MADPVRPADSQSNPPSSGGPLHLSTSAMVAPPPPHPGVSAFHYPHMYVDPVAAAAAAAFYRQQQALPTSQQQATMQQQHTQTRQCAPQSHPQQPYSYLQDPAAVTAVALQQMQLQMQLQLHAHQQQQAPQEQQPQPVHQTQSPSPTQPPSHSQPLQHSQSSAPGTTALASQPLPIPNQPQMGAVPPAAAHPAAMMPTHAHMLQQSSMAMTNRLHPHIPVVPEAQMASAYRIGRYTPAERRIRLERYREKRAQRNYNRRVKYDCRKMIANKRRRVQGRFVKREEEAALAAQHTKTIEVNGKEENTEEGTEDGTEDETKVHQPESSGSGSSGQPLEPITVDASGLSEVGKPGSDEQDSYCDQSDQVLQQFR